MTQSIDVLVAELERPAEYKYLGNFSAAEPWASVGMSCDDCKVTWTGCWDNYQCPKCGEGELPWIEPATLLSALREK